MEAMAPDGGREAPTVEEQLFDPVQGRLFDFFQAVGLLEALARAADRAATVRAKAERVPPPPSMVSIGDGGDPRREAVRFAGNVRLSFPAADIQSIARAPDAPPKMTVNFMGIAGALGPLPGAFAEPVLRRSVAGDNASRDFLDIFNHRLVSLVYRIRKRHRISLGVAEPVNDDAVRYLLALIGLGTPGLENRLHAVQDRTLLYFAGLFSREIRPMSGLVAMLRCHFGVPVQGEPLVGGFYPIEPSHRTTIGPSGQNRRLGNDAVLGARYWDPAACVEIRIGPLGVDDYLRLLPGTGGMPEGDMLAPLLTLVRLYAGEAMDVRIRLILDPAAARRLGGRRRRKAERARPGEMQTLGARPRLGYTAWVGRSFQRREVVLGGAAIERAGQQRGDA
ncbi:Hypothetical protein A7982_05573 [Minicystis rosea]|nr:Hypothetical protein A7982_05573 [Minicystis rosea]